MGHMLSKGVPWVHSPPQSGSKRCTVMHYSSHYAFSSSLGVHTLWHVPGLCLYPSPAPIELQSQRTLMWRACAGSRELTKLPQKG